MLLWLWPQPMQGSGTEFEVTDDKDAATVWPPREYHTSKRQARTFVSEYASSSGVHRRGGARTGTGVRSQKNRDLSTLSTPITPEAGSNQGGRRSRNPSRGSTTSGAAPHFPTHVRRGSEGWIVQDLTVQQRADLYDRQLRYAQLHGQEQAYSGTAHAGDGDEGEEEDYQEGLSDIEGDVYSQLPGGMQGNRVYEDYNDDGEYYDEEDEDEDASSDDVDDLPYDVASDEWDENEYDVYDDDRYEDEDGSDLDQLNPYLAYADEEEEEGDYDDEDVDVDDEVTLNGKNRHKIGRFFDNINQSTGVGAGSEEEVDEWDEGDGVDVGCRPPGLMAKGVGVPETPFSAAAAASTGQKTFYTMMLEREQALKDQIVVSNGGGATGGGEAVGTKTKSKSKKKKKSK